MAPDSHLNWQDGRKGSHDFKIILSCEALDLDKFKIRLLHLLPDDYHRPVRSTLKRIRARPSHMLPCSAPFYCWRDASNLVDIIVNGH